MRTGLTWSVDIPAFCGFRYFNEQVFREDHWASSASYDN